MHQAISLTTLRALFQHNDWANQRLLQRAEALGDDQLDQPFEMGFGSLRATITHLADVERLWLHRWRRDPPPPAAEQPSNISQLAGRLRRIAEERDAFFDAAGPDAESSRIRYTTIRGEPFAHPLGDLMLHVCNHAIHHRAQALNMLRHHGARTSNLDYIFARLEDESPPPIAFDRDTVLEYLRYSDWASRRLLQEAAQLDSAALDRPFEMGVGTLRKTLCHIHNAEQYWLANWNRETGSFWRFRDDLELDELHRERDRTAHARDDFLRNLDAVSLCDLVIAQPAPERRLSFRIGDTALQLCGHGTHHRAQALNMLRHHGGEAPRLDYVIWLREAG